jgi:hypothetical protein
MKMVEYSVMMVTMMKSLMMMMMWWWSVHVYFRIVQKLCDTLKLPNIATLLITRKISFKDHLYANTVLQVGHRPWMIVMMMMVIIRLMMMIILSTNRCRWLRVWIRIITIHPLVCWLWLCRVHYFPPSHCPTDVSPPRLSVTSASRVGMWSWAMAPLHWWMKWSTGGDWIHSPRLWTGPFCRKQLWEGARNYALIISTIYVCIITVCSLHISTDLPLPICRLKQLLLKVSID